MIHYHGTPCGGKKVDAAAFFMGRHTFISFANPGEIGEAGEYCESFALDNGAFSAWRSGNPITDWSEYYAWIEHWQRHPAFDWAIIPDVIDGTEQDNDDLLAEWPFEHWGVPVWHLHESLQRLERLVVTWPRVAFGSSGKWQTPGTQDWWDRMGEAMAVACDEHGRPRCKLHGLRILHPAIFGEIPLASADSTNAARNANSYGRFGMYCPPHRSTRLNNIAKRIEIHQSPAIWRPRAKQGVLIFTDCEDADQ